MDFKNKIVDGAVVAVIVILALIGWSFVSGHRASGPANFQAGAAGNLLAENYDGGYLQQNGGFNSALPVKTSGLLTASGGQTFSGNLTNTGTETIGANGNAINAVNFSNTGKVIAYSNTITASSTGRVDIGSTGQVGGTLTGVSVGDACDVFATTTVSSVYFGVTVLSSFASSTPGYCTVTLQNGTGGTFTWSNTASTSFAYQDIH